MEYGQGKSIAKSMTKLLKHPIIEDADAHEEEIPEEEKEGQNPNNVEGQNPNNAEE